MKTDQNWKTILRFRHLPERERPYHQDRVSPFHGGVVINQLSVELVKVRLDRVSQSCEKRCNYEKAY